jgi:hypothetical protein
MLAVRLKLLLPGFRRKARKALAAGVSTKRRKPGRRRIYVLPAQLADDRRDVCMP